MLVTGANSGLGYLTSLHLAKAGAHVIMAARDVRKGQHAREAILATRPRGRVDVLKLDLADLEDVRAFSRNVHHRYSRVDCLINNAGIMMPPRTLTKQGHELQFGVNHLAHFLLTALMLPLLSRAGDGRVVTLSSDLHKKGEIHFDDLVGSRRYGRISFYAQSKLANTLFALELHRRLKEAGCTIKSLLAHPGYAATNLQMTGPSGVLKLFMHIGNRFLAQPAAMGVLPQLYAATAPEAESGQFIGPDGPKEKKGYPSLVQPSMRATDERLATKLWRLSEELVGQGQFLSHRKSESATLRMPESCE